MPSILILDDDEPILMTMAAILRDAGYLVSTASNGSSGLMLFASWAHDLVITDISMPGADGLEVIASLRKTVPRPRIIAMSGGSRRLNSNFLHEAHLLGAQQVLEKPIEPEILLQIVAAILAEPAPPSVVPRH